MRSILAWSIPVVLIPLLWPILSAGSFDSWLDGVLSKSQRRGDGLFAIFDPFFTIDPVLLVLGVCGFGLAAVKKDIFLLLWVGPFLAFLSLIGYVQYFHVIPILAAFCISAALFLDFVMNRIGARRLAQYAAVASVVVFGLVSTALLITTNVTSSQFEAISFALLMADQDTTVVASPVYSWPYDLVFHVPHALKDYRDVIYHPIPTDKVVLISDLHLRSNQDEQVRDILLDTTSVRVFHGNATDYNPNYYPYGSLRLNYQGTDVDIRQRMP